MLEICPTKISTKNVTPATPILISKASDRAQNKATKNTCLPRMPCLKTKAFCAPIANIKDIPRKKPVKKAVITIF